MGRIRATWKDGRIVPDEAADWPEGTRLWIETDSPQDRAKREAPETAERKGKPRGWFRFGLRTVFVVVTALCSWLGWQMSVVHERRAEMNKYRANQAVQFIAATEYAKRYPPAPPGTPPPKVAAIPRVRVWLGDQAIQEIWFNRWFYSPAMTDAEVQRLVEVFPEAEVRESLPPPCHPGCFPRGTLIDTPQGPREISAIRPGELVTTLRPDGKATPTEVQSVFTTDNRLWKLVTEGAELYTTQTQPLCLATGRITPAGELQAGDKILHRGRDGLHAVTVLAVAPTDRVQSVFNLVLGDSELFVAGGFLARSKPPARYDTSLGK